MGSVSIVHWIVVLIVLAWIASPIMGVIRGVQNGSVLHSVLSIPVPFYGLIYYFVAKRP